jgi:hypothetical protein
MSGWLVFMFGGFGGAIWQFRDLYELRKRPPRQRGAWLKAPYYWSIFIGYAVIGGVIALAFDLSGSELGPWLAIYVGAVWPLLLERASAQLPESGTRID